MGPLEKINFAHKLLEEVEEEVLATLGSPPFPDLEGIHSARVGLEDYLAEHGSSSCWDTFSEDFRGAQPFGEGSQAW